MKIFGELEKAQCELLAADPTGTGLVEGRIWYRTDTFIYKAYANGAVTEFGDLSSAQTFVNKTLTAPVITDPDINGASTYDQIATPATPAASEHKIYFKADGNAYTLDSSGTERKLGSGGASGGGKNYHSEYNTNLNDGVITDFEAYDDDSGYVDGTGIDAATQFSVTATLAAGELLEGSRALKITKAAANGTGQGVSLNPVTIDRADRGRDLIGSMEVDFTDANYGSGDMKIYAYDVTNAAILSVFGLDDGIPQVQDKIQFRIPTTTTTEEVRVSIHCENDSTLGASTWDLIVDDFKYGPEKTVPGYIGSEWQSFTPTGSWTTNTTYTGKYRRVGDSLELLYDISLSGAPNATVLTLNYPSGFTQDESKIVFSGSIASGGAGEAADSSAGETRAVMAGIQASLNRLIIRNTAASGANVTNLIPYTFATGDGITVRAVVPMEGLEATNLISTTENMFKNVDVRGEGNGGTVITANVTNIDFTEAEDNIGAWDGAIFTAQESGRVNVNGSVYFNAGVASPEIAAFVNGTNVRTLGFNGATTSTHPFSGDVYLNEGDTLSIRSTQSGTLLGSNTKRHWISISSVKDTSVFAVSGETAYKEVALGAGKFTTAAGLLSDAEATATLLPLEEGLWDIGFDASVFLRTKLTTLGVIGQIAICDSSVADQTAGNPAGLIQESIGMCQHLFRGAVANDNTQDSVSRTVQVLVPPGGKSYKVMLRPAFGNTNMDMTISSQNFTGGLANPDDYPRLFARKVK